MQPAFAQTADVGQRQGNLLYLVNQMLVVKQADRQKAAPGGRIAAYASAENAVLENEHLRLRIELRRLGTGPGHLRVNTGREWPEVLDGSVASTFQLVALGSAIWTIIFIIPFFGFDIVWIWNVSCFSHVNIGRRMMMIVVMLMTMLLFLLILLSLRSRSQL